MFNCSDLTKGEIELLNAYNSIPSNRKAEVVKLVKNFTKEHKKNDYKYKNVYWNKKRMQVDKDREHMILNGIPGKNYDCEGYCYIGCDCNWSGYYKIGRTVDPSCKARQSKVINPNYKIVYRTRNLYQNARKLETEIFTKLAEFCCKHNNCTEWFKLSDKELEQLIKDYDFVKLEELGIK